LFVRHVKFSVVIGRKFRNLAVQMCR